MLSNKDTNLRPTNLLRNSHDKYINISYFVIHHNFFKFKNPLPNSPIKDTASLDLDGTNKKSMRVIPSTPPVFLSRLFYFNLPLEWWITYELLFTADIILFPFKINWILGFFFYSVYTPNSILYMPSFINNIWVVPSSHK